MTSAPAAGDSFRSAFRHRAFALFWSARVCSMLAIQMQVVAVGWQVYAMTGDPLDLGLVGLFQFLPSLALVLVAGHVVDNNDRKTVLFGALSIEMIAVAVLFLLTMAGALSPHAIFAVVALIGLAKSFEGPANQAILSATVPVEDLPNAVAWQSSGVQVAQISGPALGGLLYIAGPAAVYGVSTAMLVLSVLLIAACRPRPVAMTKRAMSLTSMLAGAAFIRSRPEILGAISLDLFAVLLGGATALLPIYARDVLLVGPWGLGLLRSAPALGALAMAMVITRWGVKRHAGRWMLIAVAGFGAATIAFGLSADPVLSFIALLAVGATDQVSMFVRQTLIQLSTPDEMRGRVGAVTSLFIGASNQLGEFESGSVAALVGAVPAVVLGGVGAVGLAGLWAVMFPALRRVDRLLGR
ncbi:MFS family permease [Azospirillum lipoferum]|uniref:MFS transporter n=1 Tax=Azospirillum lipoferum TaxID=193 RepID=A0A5A9GI53_AZOLI|nr:MULTISPECIES: MFS transporter [Azospirillum]KAA0594168.1 MFS transporter [Azospirillum lipoferum]MCP1615302.1 MFS family permease [Azospirillum lipoferum]MDW5531550.1 MFS transporter [Azospirillum sp. NL1]